MTAEELARKVRGLELRARKASGGLISGAYRSAFKGRGVEFLDVREYVPGDDVRSIDWNVTARAGHPFIKRFSEEREETVMLLVDGSLSMDFGSSGGSKRDAAAEIFAILATAAIHSNDQVGLILFAGDVKLYLQPERGGAHLLRMIRDVLAYDPPPGVTNLAGALEFLGHVRRRRSLAFVISDFRARSFDKALRAQARHHDLIAIPIHDPREMNLPDCGLIEFEDAETGERFALDSSDPLVRGAYERDAWRRMHSLDDLLRNAGVEALRIAAGSDYLRDLIAFLRRHARRAAA